MVYINLGRIYRLRLTFEVIAQYEQLFGKKLSDLNLNKPLDLANIFWLMMRQNLPSFRQDQAVKLTAEAGIVAVIRRAILTAFRAPDKREENPKSEFIDFEKFTSAAVRSGVSLNEFWSLTPAEFTDIQKETVRKYNSEMDPTPKSRHLQQLSTNSK